MTLSCSVDGICLSLKVFSIYLQGAGAAICVCDSSKRRLQPTSPSPNAPGCESLSTALRPPSSTPLLLSVHLLTPPAPLLFSLHFLSPPPSFYSSPALCPPPPTAPLLFPLLLTPRRGLFLCASFSLSLSTDEQCVSDTDTEHWAPLRPRPFTVSEPDSSPDSASTKEETFTQVIKVHEKKS